MPKRTDIHKILIIGSGPIVIGQACEFDYSGTQACRALKDEGFEVILVNSNPATIMTDPEIADKTYVEPLTLETVSAIIEKERPDALLPTVGGQTALNLSVELFEQGILDKYGVKLIGANINSIKVGESVIKITCESAPCSACDSRSEATWIADAPASAITSTSEGPAGMSIAAPSVIVETCCLATVT